MQQDRKELKMKTRTLISQNKRKVYIAAILFVALMFAISTLLTNLSGAGRYLQNSAKLYREAYNEMNEVLEESADAEEAEAKTYEIMLDTLNRASVWPETDTISIVLCAALAVLSVPLKAGYISHCLLMSRGMNPTVRDIFNSFNYTGKMFAIIVLRAAAVTLGFIFFIVPGVVLLYCYRLSIYVAYDNPQLGAIACMRESRRIVKDRKRELFALDISFIGLWILSDVVRSFTLPIIDVWIKPYIGITVAQWYDKVSGYVPEQEKGTQPQE